MITQLTALVRGYYNGSVERTLTMPWTEDGVSPYFVKSCTGLGPVKSEISQFATPLDPGGILLGARDGGRNIVLTVELQENYSLGSTAAALRQTLYTVFETGNTVELQFTTEEFGIVICTGVVESNEPGDFTTAPTNQISIICVDPYFDDQNAQTVVNVDLARAAFTSNPTNPYFLIDFDGNVPVGFTFETTAAQALPTQGVSFSKVSSLGTVAYTNLNMPVQAGDSFKTSSIKGNRYATYTRSAATQSALSWLSGSLVDMRLTPGKNYFSFQNPGSFSPNTTFLKYKKRIGGL